MIHIFKISFGRVFCMIFLKAKSCYSKVDHITQGLLRKVGSQSPFQTCYARICGDLWPHDSLRSAGVKHSYQGLKADSCSWSEPPPPYTSPLSPEAPAETRSWLQPCLSLDQLRKNWNHMQEVTLNMVKTCANVRGNYEWELLYFRLSHLQIICLHYLHWL